MKVKISYQSKNTIEKSLNDAIITAFTKLGFRETGSGYNFKTKERDISFEKKDK